jgi:hypothetical protein
MAKVKGWNSRVPAFKLAGAPVPDGAEESATE